MDGNKVILFRNYRASRPLVKLIETHLAKWIRCEEGIFVLPSDYSYKVDVEKESDSLFSCRIKIRIGESEWRSHDSGQSPQEAFFHSLKRIHLTGELPILQYSA